MKISQKRPFSKRGMLMPIAMQEQDFYILILTYMKKDLFFFYDCIKARRGKSDFCEKRKAKIIFNRMKGGVMK